MRILRVIASMDPATGGPCQGIRYSIPQLQAEGCDNEVVCLDDPSAPFLETDPLIIHALGRGRGPLRYHASLIPWLEANLSRFDAVIVHGIWLWPSIATRIATHRLRKKVQRLSPSSPSRSANSQLPAPKIPPYFVMPHGMLDPWFQKDKSRKLKALRNSIYWHLIENSVIRDASGVLFTCDQELQLARTSFLNYKPRREINVGYGVPDSPARSEAMDQSFYQQSPALPKDHPYLLFLSRIHPKKGVDLLIQAYAEVFGGRSPGKFEKPADTTRRIPALVIAGPIESDYAREMISLAESRLPGCVFTYRLSSDRQSPIPDHSHMHRPSIHFTGMLEGDAKWGALHGCDAFVLTSHQENFGISVAEALSCSKPVLISEQVNISHEVNKAHAGFVSSDDRKGAVQLLSQWDVLEIKHRDEMSLNANRLFQEQFHLRSAVPRLLNGLSSSIPQTSA